MYTAVLMLAMSTGAESLDHGCRGCNACYGCTASCCSTYRACCGGTYRSCGCTVSYGCGGGVYRTAYYGGPVYYSAGVVTPAMPARVVTGAPATIVVNVPEGARVTVDGMPTRSTGERRTFITPDLDRGASFMYTLRAEVGSNEQTATQTRTVVVRAGETSVVRFDMAPQGSAGR